MDEQDRGERWLADQAEAVASGAPVEVTRSARGYYAVAIAGRAGVIRVDERWLRQCMEHGEVERVRSRLRQHLAEEDA